MRALVTGANGLIGANLTRALLERGHAVRAFVRESSDLRSLEGLNVEIARGDVLEIDSLTRAAEACDTVFHAAAIFSYFGHSAEELIRTAVTGTTNVVEAARRATVGRVVLTSSSVVIGSTDDGTALDEDKVSLEPRPVPYVASKIRQEEVGFSEAARKRVELVAVCPTLCVGPHDQKLSESNAVVVNYLRDPFRYTWPGGCNVVSVEDVAAGHILAAERGTPGERYILGSENITWTAVHETIAELCGIEAPLLAVGHTTAFLAGIWHELVGVAAGVRPLVTRAQARMVGRYYWYRDDRAAALGYSPRPAREALAGAISWLVTSPHVPNSIRSGLRLTPEVYAQRT